MGTLVEYRAGGQKHKANSKKDETFDEVGAGYKKKGEATIGLELVF